MSELNTEEYVDISTIGIDAVPANPAPLPSSSDKATVSYWLATNPHNLHAATTDRLPSRSDVVIIGSGITGVSTAYHLVNASSPSIGSITIVEARGFCSGATGRNGGHLTAASALAYTDLAANPNHLIGARIHSLSAEDVKVEAARVVEDILAFETHTADAIREIIKKEHAGEKVGFTDEKNWHLCFDQREVDAFEHSLAQAAEHTGLRKYVDQVRRVPKVEVDQRMKSPAGIKAVYEIPGATLHPRSLVTILFQSAQRIAASKNIDLNLITDLPVLNITSSPDGESICSTSYGDIRAKYVVHSTNGYASHLLPQLSSSDTGIIPTRAQVVAVATTSGEHLWGMGLSAGGGYEYGHQRPSSESDTPLYIFGGGREYATGREWGVADDTTLNPEVSDFLHPYLANVFPQSYGEDVRREWTGIMGYTRSKDPLVGPVRAEGRAGKEYVAAGYSGHGMTRAFGCAGVVADMIVADAGRGRWRKREGFPECYLTQEAKVLLGGTSLEKDEYTDCDKEKDVGLSEKHAPSGGGCCTIV
ncbi:FAD dependent oxidoreductase [Pseudozyma hubeiensis]|nr:FAD dependent oxidoreductase [Pseudozyma hubeiensis]